MSELPTGLLGRRIERAWENLKLTAECSGHGIPRSQHEQWRSEIRRRCKKEGVRVRTGISWYGGEDNQGMPWALLYDFDKVPEGWPESDPRQAIEIIKDPSVSHRLG